MFADLDCRLSFEYDYCVSVFKSVHFSWRLYVYDSVYCYELKSFNWAKTWMPEDNVEWHSEQQKIFILAGYKWML